MKRKNIIIYVSSRNNYDMLEGEVLNNIDTEGFEFINVDDNSCEEELEKGKAICEKHGIVFLENKDRGVQMATQTLIDFINKNRPNCKWVVCFQHDIYPISKDFFTNLSNYINEDKLKKASKHCAHKIELSIGYDVCSRCIYWREKKNYKVFHCSWHIYVGKYLGFTLSVDANPVRKWNKKDIENILQRRELIKLGVYRKEKKDNG